jgi:hypothetical protein
MKVLIDDIREVPGMDLVFRTWGESYYFIQTEPIIEELVLDNDLGEDISARDGYSLLQFMLMLGVLPKQVYLITANPVAEAKMRDLLVSTGYTKSLSGKRFVLK